MKYKRAIHAYKTVLADAEQYREHPEDAGDIARRAAAKAEEHKGPMHRVFEDLATFLRLVRAWSKGEYRLIPWRSMAMVIGAVLYFLSPIDAIPDFIPVIGFVDDAFIITFVMRAIRRDVQDFREWESV
ncbi:MAG: DUF1232 domain-containing protein [Acidobacteriales bacterium]|nr:DUF1232 domain-containing protein [Terriglobales bacterium]